MNPYQSDIEFLLSKKHHLGADLWMSPQGHLNKGSPFTTLQCAMYLVELGFDSKEPILLNVSEEIFSRIQKDGRIRTSPIGTIYPCHTIIALNTLCWLGYAHDTRLTPVIDYLLQHRYQDGGWRCNKFSFGRNEETEYSNPGPTLMALDAFRQIYVESDRSQLDDAVEFLLSAWAIKKPLGPCHYGIGSRFMEIEYPFSSYNLFYYVYVLSFYKKARTHPHFHQAYLALLSQCDHEQIVVQRVHRQMRHLKFCQHHQPSVLATKRLNEIQRNVGNDKR